MEWLICTETARPGSVEAHVLSTRSENLSSQRRKEIAQGRARKRWKDTLNLLADKLE